MQQNNIACSRYTSVTVLLLYWEKRDEILEGVQEEVYKLQKLFTNFFGFNVEIWELPCDGSVKIELSHKLLDFSEHAEEGELLILYYGGHASNDAGSCTWQAGVGDHSVEWNNLAQILTNNNADVLFILDCCQAVSAVAAFSGQQARHGANWLLASSGIDKAAAPVKRTDFTRLMIKTLKELAVKFYENDLERITSEDLHTILHLDHWQRLQTNGVHIRLNRSHCRPIDLTPLAFRSDRDPHEDGFKYQFDYPLSSASTSSPTAVLDVLLVPGGDGNPFTAFTANLWDGKCMWPQEVLCPELEMRGIHCRVLPFEHHWDGHGYSDREIRNFERSSNTLFNSMYSNWRTGAPRPLLLMAYGRGCTVVHKVLQHIRRSRGRTFLPA